MFFLSDLRSDPLKVGVISYRASWAGLEINEREARGRVNLLMAAANEWTQAIEFIRGRLESSSS